MGGGIMAMLTARDREVLTLLSQGKRTDEIAATLCISASTVKTHAMNARIKAGVTTSFELAVKVGRELTGG